MNGARLTRLRFARSNRSGGRRCASRRNGICRCSALTTGAVRARLQATLQRGEAPGGRVRGLFPFDQYTTALRHVATDLAVAYPLAPSDRPLSEAAAA